MLAMAVLLAFWGGLAYVGILVVVIAAAVVGQIALRRLQAGPSVEPAVVALPANDGASLLPWIIGAVVVRWVAAVVLNGTPLWREFAPDAYFYDLAGAAIRESWSSPTVDLSPWVGNSTAVFYPYLSAFVQIPFASSRYPLSFVNGAVGVLAAYNFSLLARALYGPRAQRRVFILAAFFPSLIIWSSMSIRESWSWLALSIVLLSGQKLRERFSVLHMLGLVLGMLWMSLLRTYLVPFLVVGLVLSFVVVRARQIPYVAIGSVLVVAFVGLLGERLGISVTDAFSEESLVTVDTMRRNLAYGGSAYGASVDTTTLSGALLYFPEGVARFLLSPLPWTISSWRQAIAFPETLDLGRVPLSGGARDHREHSEQHQQERAVGVRSRVDHRGLRSGVRQRRHRVPSSCASHVALLGVGGGLVRAPAEPAEEWSMNESLLEVLAEPGTGSALRLEVTAHEGPRIVTGTLISERTGHRYPVIRGIPRFAGENNYSASFGAQWNEFRRTQLDSVTGVSASRDRFTRETGWRDEELAGRWVLDGGCGAGRFAEVAAQAGAKLVGLDLSSAVDAAARTLQRYPEAQVVQGSLLDPPFRPGSFDYAYCIGVVQHTPDPERVVEEVVRCVRSGGGFAFTIYARRPWTKLNAKYLVRPLTKRLPQPVLKRAIEVTMPVLFPATDRLFRLPLLGTVARFTIPVANYVERGDLTREERYEEALLDTHDMLSPAFDLPMTWREVERALGRAAAQDWCFNTTVPINLVGRR